MKVKIKPGKLEGDIDAISSKSQGHRDLILGALCEEKTEIFLNNFSDDILVTVKALENLGFVIERKENSFLIKDRVDVKNPQIDFKDSGSSLRFLLAIGNFYGENVKYIGSESLSKRPLKELIEELEKNNFSFSQNHLPLEARGYFKGGKFTFRGDISSQYISGILLAASKSPFESQIILKSNLESKPYADLTINELKKFCIDVKKMENSYKIKGGNLKSPGKLYVEGDWSNASVFIGANLLGSKVKIKGLNIDSLQGDKEILNIAKKFGSKIFTENNILENSKADIRSMEIDIKNTPDLAPVLCVILAASTEKSRLINAKRLRFKESDRLFSLCKMINDLGADGKIVGDSLEITGKIKGGHVNSFNDHRIVMAACLASTFAKEEIIIDGAQAVEKSYKNFFEDFKKLGGNFVCYR